MIPTATRVARRERGGPVSGPLRQEQGRQASPEEQGHPRPQAGAASELS